MKHRTAQPGISLTLLISGTPALASLLAMIGIPLAVGQPVTIPIATITGDIGMDGANPLGVGS